jgi:hypothetical protein
MSRASKTTLILVTLITGSTIFYVHKYQQDERTVSHGMRIKTDERRIYDEVSLRMRNGSG